MDKEPLIEGGNVVTVDAAIGDLPVGDVLVRIVDALLERRLDRAQCQTQLHWVG
jgi:hypothetical protein